jgi:phage-related minor tail protein
MNSSPTDITDYFSMVFSSAENCWQSELMIVRHVIVIVRHGIVIVRVIVIVRYVIMIVRQYWLSTAIGLSATW